MMKRFDKKENLGITLIALVITIIILLILAGISIAQLTGNGLFEKAKLAKEESKNAQEDEDDKIKTYGNEISGYVDGNRGTVTISEEDYAKLQRKGQWVLLASSTSSSEETKEVANLSQFSSIAVVNYSAATTVTNTSMVPYNMFKSLTYVNVRWTKSDSTVMDAVAYYTDDTHVKLNVSHTYKVELYGIY